LHLCYGSVVATQGEHKNIQIEYNNCSEVEVKVSLAFDSMNINKMNLRRIHRTRKMLEIIEKIR